MLNSRPARVRRWDLGWSSRFSRALVQCRPAVIGPLSLDCRWIVDGLCDDGQYPSRVRGFMDTNAGTDATVAGSVISLPKGDGAVAELEEKFAPDLFTGTGRKSLNSRCGYAETVAEPGHPLSGERHWSRPFHATRDAPGAEFLRRRNNASKKTADRCGRGHWCHNG